MNLSEITNSLSNNKLRSGLTGFSIAWGIILLVVMLGVGDGVEKGIRGTMSQFGASQIQMSISLRSTELPYAGYAKSRSLSLKGNQLEFIRQQFRDIVYAIEPSFILMSEVKTDYGSSNINLTSLTEREQGFSKKRITQGRRFTPREMENGERVAIITDGELSKLFESGQDPIGQQIIMKGITFTIVGVTESPNPFMGDVYIPYETYASIEPNGVLEAKEFSVFPIATKSSELVEVENTLETTLRQLLKVSPDDTWAIRVRSAADLEDTTNKMFDGLRILLWIMGIGSLSIGTIGVSNIMSVTVQERMREFGIRKAIGAKPLDIMQLVLGESLILSIGAGSIGIVLGYLNIALLDYLVTTRHWAEKVVPMGPSGKFATFNIFEHPSVDMGIAIGSLVILILAGLIAGIGPARKAIRIPAITAMRDTK